MSANTTVTLTKEVPSFGATGRGNWVRDPQVAESTLEAMASLSVGPRIGRVLGLSATGSPLVDFPGKHDSNPLLARCICAISKEDVGREAVLVFENNELSQPIVLGLLQPNPQSKSQPVSVTVDGKQLTVTAENEIVLRCGKASITLTRAGKILINGEYLLSRSNGVNRIKGGSVQIN